MSTSARAMSAVLGFTILGAVVVVQGFGQGASTQQPTSQSAPAAPAPPPQQPADQQQPPTTIRRGINYVSVDVIVSDKDGKPILDLAQNDFAVSEDGKPQTID